MDISICMLAGPSLTINVSPEDSVGYLKEMIHDKLKVPPVSQNLAIRNGQRISLSDESRSLRDYGLQSGSQVFLLVTEPDALADAQPDTLAAKIQVFLQNEKGKTSTYEIKPKETVADFKTKVYHREGVPVSQQRLIHQGREMTTGTLADYRVRALSTIHLTLRLRGG